MDEDNREIIDDNTDTDIVEDMDTDSDINMDPNCYRLKKLCF